MSVPYAPMLRYVCDDPDCCSNGCPIVTCKVCGADWPCPDYQATHSVSQIEAQERYVRRKGGA